MTGRNRDPYPGVTPAMDHLPDAVVANVNAVAAGEESVAAQRTPIERIGDTIGGFVGTLPFVGVQLAGVAAWITVNAGLISHVPAFDPFPYSLGGTMLSLEGVVLAAFVLMRQAHEGELSERRSHLNLQANLLVEQEVTKLIQMLTRQSAADGTEHVVVDDEARAMAQSTAIERLTDELDRRLK